MRAVVIALGLTVVQIASAQQSSPQESINAPRFRVATDGVRIDAVVTDRDGRIIPDLTADDFEVRQDGKLQKLLFAQFVRVIAGPAPTGVAPLPPNERSDAPPPSPSAVRREHIQRTLAVVIDDLGLSVESVQNIQPVLHAFVDHELQPSDLVALVRTGGSSDVVQSFTTDRRVLHAAIDGLRWNGFSRNGVEPFAAVNIWNNLDGYGSGIASPNDFKTVETLRTSMAAAGTLGALNLIVRGARDLPGRKAIVFVSEGFEVPALGDAPRVRIALDRVIDQATRSGVVIYAIDCRGLQSAALLASDNLKFGPLAPDAMDELVRNQAQGRFRFNQATQDGMAYLAEQTGGLAVLNTNSLGAGLGRITGDLRDYYVIGYSPQSGTFVSRGKKPDIHKISINVKRPGLTVKTRKEFLGVSDPEEANSVRTPAQQLVHAAISPFAATDVAVRATTVPGYSPEQGAFVRTLLHVDARALTFTDDESGRRTASADVLGMVFDPDGVEVAHLSTGFSVALTREGAEDALRDGLAYTLRIPIRQAGAYQVRFAVRDRQSDAIGSAGEYVEVPDAASGAFALSGIVLRSDADPVTPGLDDADRFTVTPMQALRTYPRGARLSYTYEVYNASVPVQAVMTIWRGNDKVLSTGPSILVPPHDAPRRFAAGGGVKLGESLAAGDYVLEIRAKLADSEHKRQTATAVRRIDFEVR